MRATSVITEASFESYDQQNLSAQKSTTFEHNVAMEARIARKGWQEEHFRNIQYREQSALSVLDFRFEDDLRSIAFVRSSIFNILSHELFRTNLPYWEPYQSSWLKRFLFFDVLLPEEDKDLIFKFVISKSKRNYLSFQVAYLSDPLSFLLGSELPILRFSFSQSINRKLMRYYAIRSDGPPHHSFKQVFV
ncbi:hypothetical protein [Leptospira sanjuanensis]|uniref:hypothetical protein n=1 Tax=Leptospira sanjuanensis TaxID=2879643 RepID=UPI001EE99FAE|nr:hypothetical protein [Leptospira sanjuanensis]MCG6166815.1 hypothetical protein [Leptospira sanjuanensis]